MPARTTIALRAHAAHGWALALLVISGCDGTLLDADAAIARDGARDEDAAIPDAGSATDDAGRDGGPSDGAIAGGDASSALELPPFCDDLPPADRGGSWASTRVSYGADGLLQYASDAEGNRIPDFSFAGYRYGEVDLPDVAEVERVGPGAGDDTARIQAALDRVADRALDARGLRGALVLEPGTYEIAGTLRVAASGVVLRGSGDGDDPALDTILRATGDTPHQRTVIVLGTGDASAYSDERAGSRVDVTSERVLVSTSTIEVEDATGFAVGDAIVVRHPSSAAWIAALGGGGGSTAWNAGDVDIVFYRRVRAIEGRELRLDVPVYDTLDRSLSRSYVYASDGPNVMRESGVESLRIDVVTAGGDDEDHAWTAISVVGAEDAWVRDITALHFGFAGVRVAESTRVSVLGSRALEPVAQITGSRMYNFAVERGGQQVLFADCEASLGRHHFVSNGTSQVSGIVFLRGLSRGTHASSEGHRRWSQALLYDSIVESAPDTGIVVGLYNRGDYGTFHGWSAVHSVLWRYDVGGRRAVVQRPPLGQNYAIGTIGTVDGEGPFDGAVGAIEAGEGALLPGSLYEAQLCDRLRRDPLTR